MSNDICENGNVSASSSENVCLVFGEDLHNFVVLDNYETDQWMSDTLFTSPSESNQQCKDANTQLNDYAIDVTQSVDLDAESLNKMPTEIQSSTPNRFLSTKAQLDVLDNCALDLDSDIDKNVAWNQVVRELNEKGPSRTSVKWKRIRAARKYNSKLRQNKQVIAIPKKTDAPLTTATVVREKNLAQTSNCHNIVRNDSSNKQKNGYVHGLDVVSNNASNQQNVDSIHSTKIQNSCACECTTKIWPLMSDKLDTLIFEIKKGNELMEALLKNK